MQKEDVLNKKEMCKKENECANLKSVVATLSTFSVFFKMRRGSLKTLTCREKRKWLHVGLWGSVCGQCIISYD